ncbi:hypothetical protein, partial [Streptomyces xanthophaeus]
ATTMAIMSRVIAMVPPVRSDVPGGGGLFYLSALVDAGDAFSVRVDALFLVEALVEGVAAAQAQLPTPRR